jgi:hypothetical protein
MDIPPTPEFIASKLKSVDAPFIDFKPKPEYTPVYHWNDDERNTKDYIQYYEDRSTKERYADDSINYVPVFKVMKEYYDEEKKALCRNSSFSSFDDDDYYEGDYVNTEGWTSDEVSPYASDDEDVGTQPQTQPLPSSSQETEEQVPVVNKFMYT